MWVLPGPVPPSPGSGFALATLSPPGPVAQSGLKAAGESGTSFGVPAAIRAGVRQKFAADYAAFGGFWTHLWRESCPSPEVEGDGGKGDLSLCLGQADIANDGKTHPVLPGGEGGLHRRPVAGDEPIVVFEPWRQLGVVFVGPPGDTGFDAGSLQPRAPGLGVVGRIGPDAFLVAPDQPIRRHRVGDIGRVVLSLRMMPEPSSTPTCAL